MDRPLPDSVRAPQRQVAARGSRLARLQQVLVLGALALALAWALFWWPHSPVVGLAGAAALLGGYALVLALEGLAAARANRHEQLPRAGVRGVLGAWWQEVRAAPATFAWRQPFRWRCLPDDATPSSFPGPTVVFLHGFVCNRGFWLPWMAHLRARGVPYVSVNLEPVFGEIDAYVPLVDEAVRRARELTGRPPLLVCHSMGGLAARAWLAAQPQAAVERPAAISRVVTIGTPHRGTRLARFSRVGNGRQMRPEGEWLAALAARERELRGPSPYARFTCFHSNTDNIVFPASSGRLPGADNRLVPGAAHVALAFHPRVLRETLELLHAPDPAGAA